VRGPVAEVVGYAQGCPGQPRARKNLKVGKEKRETANLKRLTASLGQPDESQTEGLRESSIWKVIEMLVSTGRRIGGC